MSEQSSSQNEESTPKEQLYNLFYELLSEIKGCKIEIDEDEYQENVQNITFPQLIQYIRETIQILLKKKTSKEEEIDIMYQQGKIKPTSFEIKQYEDMIKLMESKERYKISMQFQHNLQREAYESKINDYIKMEEEFEEMKAKYKFENGKFLDNDRKDNEILILRSENANLKKAIKKLEDKFELVERKLKEKDKELLNITNYNNTLKTKLNEKEKEIESISVLNINNNNNCTIIQPTTSIGQMNSISIPSDKIQLLSNQNNIINTLLLDKKGESKNNNNNNKIEKSKSFKKPISNLLKNNNSNSTQGMLKFTKGKCALIHQETSNKSYNDFFVKYLISKHNKNKSQLNISSIKGAQSNFLQSFNIAKGKKNSIIPPINQGNIKIYNYSSKKVKVKGNLSAHTENNANKKIQVQSSKRTRAISGES